MLPSALAGIASGFVAIAGFLKARRLEGWTRFFLLTTGLTSLTGFLFPFHKLMPPHIVGTISLLILALAVVGRYRFDLRGAWRPNLRHQRDHGAVVQRFCSDRTNVLPRYLL
jgi:hypothetical protein